MSEIKEKIQKVADEKYSGSYRFFKNKNLQSILTNEEYSEILQTVPPDLHFPVSLMVHCYMSNVHQVPKCACGNVVPFNTSKKEFAIYCSNKCKWDDNDRIQEVKRATNIEKYGAINILSSEYGMNKARNTLLKKYGVDNYTKTEEYKKSALGRKHSEESKEKTRIGIKKKFYDGLKERFPSCVPLFEFSDYEGVKGYKQYPWRCNTCNKEFISSCDNGSTPICNHCKPTGSMHEVVIKQYLDSLSIDYRFRWRGLPSGREIDIYIPHKNLGIELCGLFFHSTAGYNYSKNDHISKLNECEENGIKLFTIFDDEMYDPKKKRIVLSKIKNKIGLVRRKIYARKCEIVEVSPDIAKSFMEKYHIQGSIGASHRYGLSYMGRLVALMTFNKGRIATGNSNIAGAWELGRYCTIFNFSIVGGTSKLLKHFQRTISPTCIISYADRRWSDGGVYHKLGFDFIKDTIPNYWYTKSFKTREHRMNYQKHKLKHFSNYSDNLTEEEIMKLEKYHRIWDCGSKVFQLQSFSI